MATTSTKETTATQSNNSNNSNTQSFGERLISFLKPQYITEDKAEKKILFSLQSIFQSVDFEKYARDSYGNLHPQYQQSIRNGYDAIKDYAELYSNDVLNGIREIDMSCIKTADRKIERYEQCKQVMNNKVHRQVIVPLVNASALLYKMSNHCLLKGNSVKMCADIVSDHTLYTFKLAADKIKEMTVLLTAQILHDVKPAQYSVNNMVNE